MVSVIKPKPSFVSLRNIVPYLKICQVDFLRLLILLISDSFPELWEVPLVDYQSKDGKLCNFINSCTPPDSAREAFELFDSNFERHYTTNRAPFFMLLEEEWLANSTYFEGMFLFLELFDFFKHIFIYFPWRFEISGVTVVRVHFRTEFDVKERIF